ncbi:Mth938-like domain-containing protein [Pacificispira sp.]|uniref:Mth938-like domain-containing protein n=1 Tax=Pacificispira sp. TaxID=2888761 RepID=UPI003BAA48FB
MDITPAVPDSRMMIDSYGPGRFQVRGKAHTGSLIVMPGAVLEWPVSSVSDLTLESLTAIRDASPPLDILLLGTGEKMALVPSALRKEIRAAGISMDIMDTGAACRTFNVLMVEGRRAAAALIALESDIRSDGTA